MRCIWSWVAGSEAELEDSRMEITPRWGYRGEYRRFFSHPFGVRGLLNLGCLSVFEETHESESDNP
jgi:hypothetical protein